MIGDCANEPPMRRPPADRKLAPGRKLANQIIDGMSPGNWHVWLSFANTVSGSAVALHVGPRRQPGGSTRRSADSRRPCTGKTAPVCRLSRVRRDYPGTGRRARVPIQRDSTPRYLSAPSGFQHRPFLGQVLARREATCDRLFATIQRATKKRECHTEVVSADSEALRRGARSRRIVFRQQHFGASHACFGCDFALQEIVERGADGGDGGKAPDLIPAWLHRGAQDVRAE